MTGPDNAVTDTALPPRRRALITLCALVPLAAAGIAAGVAGITPADSWRSSAEESAQVAPVAAIDDPTGAINDVRRASMDATKNAGFLASGTSQLKSGTTKLRGGAGDLGKGVDQAVDGAQQLADGMIKLQAATGEMGTGATRLADGIGGAVDSVQTLAVVKGQLADAAQNLDRELAQSQDPRAGDMRRQLADFRAQLDNAELGAPLVQQLTEAKDGSRELANQLAVPGYGFHDGIFAATDGAKRLSSGLRELQDGTGQALDGVAQLDDGASRLEAMAKENREKLLTVQRGLAVPGQPVAEGEAPSHLTPIFAALISLLVAGAGAACGLVVARGRSRIDAAVLAVCGVVLGPLLAGVLGADLGAGLVAVAGVSALLVVVSAGLAASAVTLLGRWAHGVVALGLLAQVGLVAWAWSDSLRAVQLAANVMPAQWAAGALSAVANSGSATALWGGVGALVLALVACGLGYVLAHPRAEA